MKFDDKHLDRLLKGAALHSGPVEENIPFALQTRTLAGLRSARANAAPVELLPLFRIGLAAACALSVLAVAAGYREISREPAHEFALPNAVINLALSR